MWEQDSGLDVTAAFIGITTPIRELYDEIHRRGWTVKKVDVKNGAFRAEAQNPHGESLEALGKTDATAVGNLLMKVMRREHARSSAQLKVGMWDIKFEDQLSEIAQAYADAPIYDPKAAAAWIELAQDSDRRAQTLQSQLAVQLTNDPAPYKSADEMRKDVQEKQHIFVTRANAHHPVWSVDQMVAFRLVHDVLGHCVAGGDWGWHGENLACAAHFPLLSETAQKALFTEALGQSAFGAVYRSWGAQKIAFLDDLIEEAQGKENRPGHAPVHPSQAIAPTKIPNVNEKKSNVIPVDPNYGWKSGVDPLPDNAFLWQRDTTTGKDPLDSYDVMDNMRRHDIGLAQMPPALAKQSVVNALRGTLITPRKTPQVGATHYQDIMGIPADVDDPITYWDALESRRNAQNQAYGYPADSHQPFWAELQQFKSWLRATNPEADDAQVDRQSKRELLHMLQEEEERVVQDDKGEELPADLVEDQAFQNIRKRLNVLTKPRIDDKTDFGDSQLFRAASSGGYGPYLTSHLRPIGEVSKHADYLTDAALSDLREHKGQGHHFRAAALALGIPGVGPRQTSLAWHRLAPQTSQLAVLDPHVLEALGHQYGDLSDRDYFKFERELAAGRDAAGYSHIPLGPFSRGLYEMKVGGPGYREDETHLLPHSPTPHTQIDWQNKTPLEPQGWSNPYWWDSTAQAREDAGTGFDQSIGINHPKGEVPFQPRTSKVAGPGLRPFFMHPDSGEQIIGEPGMSLMQHIQQQLGLPDVHSVWANELEVGKQ